MSLKILRSVTFFVLLHRLDLDLAAQARAEQCAICGGPLHASRYPRKLRGVPEELVAWFTRRESFCCAREGCRKRTTPPSVVFFGRRSYLAGMVLLVSALADGASERRLARLSGLYGIDRRTLLRWRKWWEQSFPQSDFFTATAGGGLLLLSATAGFPVGSLSCSVAAVWRVCFRRCCFSVPSRLSRSLLNGLLDGLRKPAEEAS